MVKFTRNAPQAEGGPSSAIGIMRFFDSESKSPKLNPYFVAGGIIVFIILMLILKMTVFKTL